MTISVEGSAAVRDAGEGHHEGERYGLLPAQAGFVHNHLRGPATGVDVVQVVIGAAGEQLRRDAWEIAWARALERHEALRTSFGFDTSGELYQQIRPETRVEVDWREGDDVDRDERGRTALDRYLADDRGRSFDISGAHIRIAVLQARPSSPAAGYTIVFTYHHSVLDGRSVRILFTELYQDYDAICAGGEREFPPARPYRDFVEWWQGLDFAADRAFWTGYLAGTSAPQLTVPGMRTATTGGPDTSTSSADAAVEAPAQRRSRLRVGEPTTREIALDREVSDALRAAAERAGVSVGTMVNAAWAVALGRYRADDDVLFAVTRSCRHATVEGADSMVGLLINSVPLRVRLRPDLTVGELLAEVSAGGRDIRRHQLAPLGDIQRWGNLSAGLPDTLVVFEHEMLGSSLTKADPSFGRRTVRIHRLPSFPITLYGFNEPEIRVLLIFDGERFAEPAAGPVLGHVRRVLAALAGDPAARVADIDLADTDEHTRIVEEWNATRFAYPREATVPEIFARQVEQRPDAVAVSFGGSTLTYAELDARANQLAHELRSRGVGLETPVAVALPRSLELIVTLLAVLKADGAYVPIDLANPPARSAYLLRDCAARLVVTNASLADRFEGVPVLAMDTLDLATRPSTAPATVATAENLAYLCYTSGSTGLPKGTAVPHRGVVRLVHDPGYVTLGPDETILQLCAVAFDVSVFEIWGALLTGGRLAVAPPGPLTVAQIGDVLSSQGVTTAWLTAGLFHQVVELDVTVLSGIRQLLAGGDAIDPGAVRAALSARGNMPVINGYGPTEATTFGTAYRMTDPAQVGMRTPIGTPIPQSTAYVLDDALRPLPVGVAGELCLGGDGVARGYSNRPGLTADKFVPDPYSPYPGARMYRTGDLARWRADGVIEFLGRLDGQVKIRGFRVEPGEVEAVLRNRPEVREAVVVVRGDGEAKHLVAYVTTIGGERSTVAGALLEHLARMLPDYLVPSAVVVLDALPLNISGKVDKRALPEPGSETAAAATPSAASAPAPAAPQSAVQRRLAEIWREILRIEHVEAGDDFFGIGGNSLTATRLIFRLRAAFGVDLPLMSLYDDPTLAGTAAAVEALMPPGVAAALDGGTPAGATAPSASGITRRDRSTMRAADTPAPMASPPVQPVAEALATAVAATAVTAPPIAPAPAPSQAPVASGNGATAQAATPSEQPAEASAYPPHLVPLTGDWALWRWVCLRAAGFPYELQGALGDEALAAAADRMIAAAGDEQAAAEYDAQFLTSERALAVALYGVGGDPRFRTAVGWQNRTAMATGIDVLLRRDPHTVRRNGNYRRYEALIANYLQRYCAKNDSIGFFGPVGWVDIRPDGPALDHRPHPLGALARTTLYFEEWAIQQLAEALAPGLERWSVPRRMPLAALDRESGGGALLRIPFAPPTPVDALAVRVFAQVDAERTAIEVVAATLADGGEPVAEPAVWETLTLLHDLRALHWELEVSAEDTHAEDSLRAALSRVDDPALGEPALAALDELEAGRAAVGAAAATGDPEALVAALTRLDETFTRLTGAPATRRAGEMYAGRTLVFEECLRAPDVTFGKELFDSLAAPMELVLQAARWYTTAGAALLHRACLSVYRERAAAAGATSIPLAEFWLDVSSLIFADKSNTVGPIGRVIRDRWAQVLNIPEGVRHHRVSSAEIRDDAMRLFAMAQPGWTAARQHSPDIMLAAASAEAVRDGDFFWVLGEIHPGLNTTRYATWVEQHPEPEAMKQAMRQDIDKPVVWMVPTTSFGATPARLANVLQGPQDQRLVFAPDSSGYDPKLARFVGDYDIAEVDGKLQVTSRVDGETWTLVEFIADSLSTDLSQHYGFLPPARHTPRVSIDNLVLHRETWRFTAGELDFAATKDEKQRYVQCRAWMAEHDLPRHVFVRAQGEIKPVYADLTSLSSVDLVCRLARRVKMNHGDAGDVVVSEMLPTPDQLWLSDSQGRRYTSELRVCAVDRVGRP